jgi:hypothetical protein
MVAEGERRGDLEPRPPARARSGALAPASSSNLETVASITAIPKCRIGKADGGQFLVDETPADQFFIVRMVPN